MTQLAINNLDFCDVNYYHQDQVKGGKIPFDVSFDVFSDVFNSSGSVTAGIGVAVAAAVGGKDSIAYTFVSA